MSITATARRSGIILATALLSVACGRAPAVELATRVTGLPPGDEVLEAATVEPLPPIALEITPLGLQKQARGGAGTLLLRVASAVPLDDVVVDLRLPDGVTLQDGSSARRWQAGLRAGDRLRLPIEVLAGRDGSFVISAEVTGRRGDQALRSGLAYTLDIGTRRPLPEFRHGAHEFRGIAGRGGR